MKKMYLHRYKNMLDTFRGGRLKARSIRGAAWATIGYGSAQFIRLASNLLLTRILFPEAFGLMALVTVFMVGLEMFSDLGISPSIIQNRRGNEPEFLNTAWTIQVCRGFLLFLAVCVLAWPAAQFYDEKMLLQLLPVAGLNAVISGFNPTKVIIANRNLVLGRRTIIDLTSQILAVIATVTLAWITHSVWALVLGGLVGAICTVLLYTSLIPGQSNQFHWDKGSAIELIRFGKWIFLSSCIGFLVNQGDKLILAKYMSLTNLGLYSIAFMFASAIPGLSSRLDDLVFFPIYSQLQDESTQNLRPRILKARIAIISALLPPLLVLIALGDNFIRFLYDVRYWDAGWMLQVLSAGYAVVVGTNIGPLYLSRGNVRLFSLLIAVKAVIFITCVLVASHYFGYYGVIFGVAATNAVFYPIQISVYRYYGLWIWWLDLMVFFAIGSCIYVATQGYLVGT